MQLAHRQLQGRATGCRAVKVTIEVRQDAGLKADQETNSVSHSFIHSFSSRLGALAYKKIKQYKKVKKKRK